jgi:hypothetical protein
MHLKVAIRMLRLIFHKCSRARVGARRLQLGFADLRVAQVQAKTSDDLGALSQGAGSAKDIGTLQLICIAGPDNLRATRARVERYMTS